MMGKFRDHSRPETKCEEFCRFSFYQKKIQRSKNENKNKTKNLAHPRMNAAVDGIECTLWLFIQRISKCEEFCKDWEAQYVVQNQRALVAKNPT